MWVEGNSTCPCDAVPYLADEAEESEQAEDSQRPAPFKGRSLISDEVLLKRSDDAAYAYEVASRSGVKVPVFPLFLQEYRKAIASFEVVRNVTDERLGVVGAYPRQGGEIEIGIYLEPNARDLGLGVVALDLACEELFQMQEVEILIGETPTTISNYFVRFLEGMGIPPGDVLTTIDQPAPPGATPHSRIVVRKKGWETFRRMLAPLVHQTAKPGES
jgi:hypothetical protein